MSPACAQCGGAAVQRCAGCSVPYYCGRACQKADWKRHRSACQPLEVKSAPGLGRFTIASRQLTAGQLLIREQPIAAGPQLESEPQCLGCGRLLVGAEASSACARCRWPVCDERCAQSAAHAGECPILARDPGDRPVASPHPTPRYDCILPLRLLLVKDQPKVWEKVEKLESHAEQRRGTAIYKDNQEHIVSYLRDRCAVEVSAELLHRLCGVLDVNAFSLRPRPGFGRRRGLFPRTSLLNHACVSNTQLSLDGDVMMVRAAVAITPGSDVTATYISAYDPTARRQDFLFHGKYFRCVCARCKDPTELGTHYGSHRCVKCKKLVISSDPLDPSADWRCTGCDVTQSAVEVRKINELLQAERQVSSENDIPKLEAFLRRHGDSLHDTNYHVLSVKQALAQTYGNVPCFQLDQISEGRLVAKELFCRQLIANTLLFEPGLCRLRGLLLIQLHHAVVTRAQRRHAAGEASPGELLSKLEEGGRLVEEAISLLGFEPASTPEGGPMLQLAKETLQGCYELTELVRNSLRR